MKQGAKHQSNEENKAEEDLSKRGKRERGTFQRRGPCLGRVTKTKMKKRNEGRKKKKVSR